MLAKHGNNAINKSAKFLVIQGITLRDNNLVSFNTVFFNRSKINHVNGNTEIFLAPNNIYTIM